MKSFLNKVISCEIFGLNTDTKNMEAKNKNL